MITFCNVNKSYPQAKGGPFQAVCDLSLEIGPSEFVILTGRSGSGKTTVLNLIAGLTKPTAGQVLVDGIEVWKLPDAQQAHLRNEKIGFVFQFPSLIPSLTVLENVLLPTIFGEKTRSDKNRTAEAQARALGLLEEVGLSDKLHSLPRQLSAGQQQRVVIARALINQPELLLADEPTSNLDEQTEIEVMELFRQIHGRKGIAIVLVTHTAELVSYGTRALRMVAGAITENSLQVARSTCNLQLETHNG